MSFMINRGAAQVALDTSGGSAVFGQAITIVATVTAAVTPSGTVTFSDGGTPLATVPLDGSGQATLTTADLAIGSHSITATYSGDAHFVATVSGSASESVARSTTHVVLVPQAVFRHGKVVSIGLKAEIQPCAARRGHSHGRREVRIPGETWEEDQAELAADGGPQPWPGDADPQAEASVEEDDHGHLRRRS